MEHHGYLDKEIPHLPLETLLYTYQIPNFTVIPQSSSQLGGNSEFVFTP